jgi:hypothetical protein
MGDEEDLTKAVHRHHTAPEAPVEAMWQHVRGSVPKAAARRTRRRALSIAAGIAAVLTAGVLWPRPPVAPSEARLPETTSRALRDTVSELDAAILDLDTILRSDPANQVVKEMRARFDRQRVAWLERRPFTDSIKEP